MLPAIPFPIFRNCIDKLDSLLNFYGLQNKVNGKIKSLLKKAIGNSQEFKKSSSYSDDNISMASMTTQNSMRIKDYPQAFSKLEQIFQLMGEDTIIGKFRGVFIQELELDRTMLREEKGELCEIQRMSEIFRQILKIFCMLEGREEVLKGVTDSTVFQCLETPLEILYLDFE